MIEPDLYLGKAYKFCSLSALCKIFENQSLRFSRGDDLKDVYELSPFLMPLNWDEIVNLPREAGNAIVEDAFKRVCSSLYITCFAKDYKTTDSHLMWGHYADSHRGCCFELDFSAANLREQHGFYPVSVAYSDCLLTERNKRTDDSEDLPIFLASYKSKVWEYEQEVRLVLVDEGLAKETYKSVDASGKKIDVDFEPKSIKKVVFGAKTSVDEMAGVTLAFIKVGHKPSFSRMDIDPLTLAFSDKNDHLDGLFEKLRSDYSSQTEAGFP